MSYNYDYDMKYTDNPYIDLLVHNTKIMAINSVVKNEREALKYETLESRRSSDILISYKAGIPVDPYFEEEDYVELNNYYRMLAGLPPFPTDEELRAYREANIGPKTNTEPLYTSKYILLDQYQFMIPEDTYINVEGRYLHELNNDMNVIGVLESCGVITQIKADYPGKEFKYVYHIGEKAVDPYKARIAENFSLLYCPSISFEEIYYKFLKVFDRNRRYTISTIYSEAYAYGSEHYDNFIQILIILQTMIDMIGEVQEYIINKDVFDSRTIRYLFESYGIEYYKEIPVRYQLNMIKNVNTLLKYKSTNRNIVDICSLFGFPDIEVFTYYLLKTKKVSKDVFEYYTQEDVGVTRGPDGKYVTEDMVGLEKYMSNYDLQFLRVPILDANASEYIEDRSARRDYDFITNQDPFWDGTSKADILTDQEKENYHMAKKKQILGKDFSCERTKYISVDAAIDITKMSYQMSYFMNILFDKHIDEEKLMLDVDNHISISKVKLNDIFALLIALGYVYNGIEPDLISADMERNMTINGFNFDTDWSDIFEKLSEMGYNFYDEEFLSGRYSESELWDKMQNFVVIDSATSYPEYTFSDEGYHGWCYPSYLDGVIRDGSYTGVRMDPDTGEYYHIIDITWETPYDPGQNSGADFINSDEIAKLPDDATDLERFNKLKEVYYTNTKLYDHLTYMMRTAENKRMYDIYNTLYESFMETKLCHEFYNIRDENGNTIWEGSQGIFNYDASSNMFVSEDSSVTYNAIYDAESGEYKPDLPLGSDMKPKLAKDHLEFLANRNLDLYNILLKARTFSNRDEQKSYISSICDYIAYALEKYFGSEEWKYIFNIIPTRNIEFIQQCILKVIIFFKSWKTQMLGQTVEYIIDDKNDNGGNYVHIIDDMFISSKRNFYEKVVPLDYHDFLSKKSPSEKVDIIEKVSFSYTYTT